MLDVLKASVQEMRKAVLFVRIGVFRALKHNMMRLNVI